MNTTIVSMIFCAALVAGLLLGMWRSRRGASALERTGQFAMPPLLVIAAMMVIGQAFKAPFEAENGLRLTATFTIFSDYRVYAFPDEGPILCNMYPPMAYLVFLPATLASSPTAALIVASAVSLLALLGVTVAVLAMQRGRAPGWVLMLSILAAVFAIIHSPSTWFSAHRVRPDGAVLAMGALAAAILIRSRSASFRMLLLCGAAAALAVWTKQVFVFLYPPLIVIVLLLHGRRGALRFVGACFLSGLAVSAVFVVAFWPPDRLLYNFVQLPGRQPFYDRTIREWSTYLFDFLDDLKFPLILVLAVIFMSRRSDPAGTDTGNWWHRNRWALWLVIAAGMLPAMLLNQVKVGGLPNANAFVIYFVLLAGVTGCLAAHTPRYEGGGEAWPVALPLAMAMALGILAVPIAMLTVRDSTDCFINDNQQCHDFLIRGDDSLWFPWQPLGSYLATGKLYHSEEGLASLHWLAGQPRLSAAVYAKHLPRQMKYIAVPERWAGGLQGKSDYFGTTSRTVTRDDLPGWLLYELASPGPSKITDPPAVHQD